MVVGLTEPLVTMVGQLPVQAFVVATQFVFSLFDGGLPPPVPCARIGEGANQPENRRPRTMVAMIIVSSIGRRPA
jgi:hypothetical protein